MNFKLILSFLLFGYLPIFSCTKEKVPKLPVKQLNIAPCPLVTKNYTSDTVFYGPSASLPQAKYRIRFYDSLSINPYEPQIEYAFNRIPTTGKYWMVTNLDTTSTLKTNQICTLIEFGSFKVCSGLSDGPIVYVEKNSTELIISVCAMYDTGIYYFDPMEQCWIGNEKDSLKIRKVF